MYTRRGILLGMISAFVAACSEPPPPTNAEPVWLSVSATTAGVEYRVDEEVVGRERLEQVLLEHAIAANPGMTPERARNEVGIYVRFGPGASMETIQDLTPLFDRFRRVGIVAEDRRE